MDEHTFDATARWLARHGSRRAALRLGVGVLAAVPALLAPGGTTAACRKPGKECSRGQQCCSGLCKGGRCRSAPGQGTCTIAADVCAGTGVGCVAGQPCSCFVTSRGAAFCGARFDNVCSSCREDADCEFVTGPGSACVRRTGVCGCLDDDRGFTHRCVPRC
jgi:hypothetical protein